MAKNNSLWLIIGVIAVVVLVMNPSILGGLGGGTSTAPTVSPADQTAACNYQPTATYSAKDKFASTAISGTGYYKQDGSAITTTSITNLNKGENYLYWLDNATYYVAPVEIGSANCGVNAIVAQAYQNSSPTFTGYDLVNRQSVTDSVYNTSMGANDRASIEFTYQGTSKQSFMPFGGVLVVAYNSTIASVTCTGADITEANDFHVTYTPAYTTHTYKVWKVLPSLDDGSGTVNTIDCQFQNGATAAGSAYAAYTTVLYPANYYVTNDGELALDVEKYLNQDTTKTGKGAVTKNYYWGA